MNKRGVIVMFVIMVIIIFSQSRLLIRYHNADNITGNTLCITGIPDKKEVMPEEPSKKKYRLPPEDAKVEGT